MLFLTVSYTIVISNLATAFATIAIAQTHARTPSLETGLASPPPFVDTCHDPWTCARALACGDAWPCLRTLSHEPRNHIASTICAPTGRPTLSRVSEPPP